MRQEELERRRRCFVFFLGFFLKVRKISFFTASALSAVCCALPPFLFPSFCSITPQGLPPPHPGSPPQPPCRGRLRRSRSRIPWPHVDSWWQNEFRSFRAMMRDDGRPGARRWCCDCSRWRCCGKSFQSALSHPYLRQNAAAVYTLYIYFFLVPQNFWWRRICNLKWDYPRRSSPG